jgi:chemotaxis protein CheX
MPPPVAISEPARAAPPSRAVAEPGRSASAALRLPTSLDLAAARPLANSLLERRGRPVEIDASAVSQVGAQCAQVLLSAKRTWDADGVALSIVNCGPRMIEDFALIGIDCTRLATGESPK